MSQPDTHIVYRNRAEHDFYESGMMVPLIGGLGAGFITMLILAAIAEKFSRGGRQNGLVVGGCCIASLCVGVLTFNWLFI